MICEILVKYYAEFNLHVKNKYYFHDDYHLLGDDAVWLL
jgi:hypothetical protein